MSEIFDLQLTSTRNIDDNTVHFEFKILNNKKLELIAGQFIRLLFEHEGEQVFRSYSVANILKSNQDQIEIVELAVSWVKGGMATVGLSNMKLNETIQASAPYGRFCLTDDKWKRYFLVATGTGVTPYRAMSNELLSRINTDDAEVFVVMGARAPDGLLYSDEFRQFSENENYNYITCLSREQLDNPSHTDLTGHVQTYLKQINFNPETDIVFLCGNPAMVDDAFQLLKDAGMPVPQIRREKYVSPPVRKKKVAFNIK